MAGSRLQAFFGDDLEETLDSLKSAPGAFGNILVAAVRQIKLIDAALFSVVALGWVWIVAGYLIGGNAHSGLLTLAILPSILWLLAGLVAGVIFHIGGIGYRSLAYWESYLLILLFAVFGVMSLRLALDPRDRRIHRATPSGSDP